MGHEKETVHNTGVPMPGMRAVELRSKASHTQNADWSCEGYVVPVLQKGAKTGSDRVTVTKKEADLCLFFLQMDELECDKCCRLWVSELFVWRYFHHFRH